MPGASKRPTPGPLQAVSTWLSASGPAAAGAAPAPRAWTARRAAACARTLSAPAPTPTPCPPPQQQPPAAAGDTFSYPAGSPSTYAPSSFGDPNLPGRLSEPAKAALSRAARAMRRYGWLAFWTQLTMSVVSGVILLFSVAFTSQVRWACGSAVCAVLLCVLCCSVCRRVGRHPAVNIHVAVRGLQTAASTRVDGSVGSAAQEL